ncbi:hypothetical protein VARIO8X_160106 [Burkholderiales bacterium 8X]|nr:hypothetical protein VARIO8X_160106 [Burkholderiales bacterium 8X]
MLHRGLTEHAAARYIGLPHWTPHQRKGVQDDQDPTHGSGRRGARDVHGRQCLCTRPPLRQPRTGPS